MNDDSKIYHFFKLSNVFYLNDLVSPILIFIFESFYIKSFSAISFLQLQLVNLELFVLHSVLYGEGLL